MFKRKLPELTNEAFSRWLRAQRPPWEWFLTQPELIQEQLAILGDEYVFEIGQAVADSVPKNEEAMAREMAADAASRLIKGETLSMGGLTERRDTFQRAVQHNKDSGRTLMGRKPDEVAG